MKLEALGYYDQVLDVNNADLIYFILHLKNGEIILTGKY